MILILFQFQNLWILYPRYQLILVISKLLITESLRFQPLLLVIMIFLLSLIFLHVLIHTMGILLLNRNFKLIWMMCFLIWTMVIFHLVSRLLLAYCPHLLVQIENNVK